jgi:prepilin-type N-terminal cleavage/methylation domain-containing protein
MGHRFRTPFHKQNAFTLIEILLVLAIFAVILMMGIKRFSQYREHMQVIAVQSDINQISTALDQYFYVTGCDQSGTFPTDKLNPSLSDLGIDNFVARLPLIVGYSAHVIDSKQTSASKPIYLLQIIATLNPNLSAAQINWYRQVFNAGQVDANNLIWQTTPNNRISNSLNSYWILDGQRAIFRNIQNGLQDTQYSYCAQ